MGLTQNRVGFALQFIPAPRHKANPAWAGQPRAKESPTARGVGPAGYGPSEAAQSMPQAQAEALRTGKDYEPLLFFSVASWFFILRWISASSAA